MWYRVDLLFAKAPKAGQSTVKCESCNVLFEATSALEAYDKALLWASAHIEESAFELVGIEHIARIDEEQPGDGTEVGGMFFDEENVWKRRTELIPEKSKLPAILWEENADTPIFELMTEKQREVFREVFDEE